jgi:hypothetical protein
LSRLFWLPGGAALNRLRDAQHFGAEIRNRRAQARIVFRQYRRAALALRRRELAVQGGHCIFELSDAPRARIDLASQRHLRLRILRKLGVRALALLGQPLQHGLARDQHLLAFSERTLRVAQPGFDAGKARLQPSDHQLPVVGEMLQAPEVQRDFLIGFARAHPVMHLDHRRAKLRLQIDSQRLRLRKARVRLQMFGAQRRQRFALRDERRHLAAKLGAIARARFALLCEPLFETPLAHGEFRAQQIAIGEHFFHRQRGLHLEAARGKPHRATPQRRQYHEPQQSCDEDAEGEKHRLFNHTICTR